MEGRLEHQIKTEKNIQNILSALPEYVTSYYNNISVSKEPKTCLEYIKKVRGFLSYKSVSDITEISEEDVSQYLHYISTKNVNGELQQTSFSYRKLVHSVLLSFFNYLYNSNIIYNNPMLSIQKPQKNDYINRKRISKDELNDILQIVNFGAGNYEQVCRQKNWRLRDKCILMLLICTGMRETALTEINLDDIDLENKKLIITDKRHKTICYYLNDEMLETVKEWIIDRSNKLGSIKEDSLFISNQKKRMSQTAVVDIVSKYSKEALGYKISPHKLRAAFCTTLYEQTGDIEFVRDAVGHSNIATTQRYIAKNDDVRKKSVGIIMEGVTL